MNRHWRENQPVEIIIPSLEKDCRTPKNILKKISLDRRNQEQAHRRWNLLDGCQHHLPEMGEFCPDEELCCIAETKFVIDYERRNPHTGKWTKGMPINVCGDEDHLDQLLNSQDLSNPGLNVDPNVRNLKVVAVKDYLDELVNQVKNN